MPKSPANISPACCVMRSSAPDKDLKLAHFPTIASPSSLLSLLWPSFSFRSPEYRYCPINRYCWPSCHRSQPASDPFPSEIKKKQARRWALLALAVKRHIFLKENFFYFNPSLASAVLPQWILPSGSDKEKALHHHHPSIKYFFLARLLPPTAAASYETIPALPGNHSDIKQNKKMKCNVQKKVVGFSFSKVPNSDDTGREKKPFSICLIIFFYSFTLQREWFPGSRCEKRVHP